MLGTIVAVYGGKYTHFCRALMVRLTFLVPKSVASVEVSDAFSGRKMMLSFGVVALMPYSSDDKAHLRLSLTLSCSG